ncbi:type VI secretion system baseplate subunit TssG [Saccharospirillum alexandrii]|uniref:type VI secretion system baseplate subunit TssG n=1 Tax=Saccharospirillum alexandrii TaxID=2448477 RepID=UPI000FD9989A|nr:type VI secretion system baseplate subunit TssG [Saccharospirillum alexandrii]
MDQPDGTSIADLKQDLLDNSQDFDFFQAYRLLQRLNALSTRSRFDQRDIRVRPNLELGYGDTDIHEVLELPGNKGFEMVTNLAGLYGISSPLPDFYTEELLDYEWEGYEGPRAFLDILNNHLLTKLFDAWRLNRLTQNTIESRLQDYRRLIASVSNNPALEHEPDDELAQLKLRFSGLFSLYSKSATGLKTLLQGYLETDEVDVVEHYRLVAPVPERDRLRLGQQATVLGQDAHLGSRVTDYSSGICVRIGPMSEAVYREQFVDARRWALTNRLIREYLVEPLAIQLELLVRRTDKPASLGEHWNHLGQTSYLGQINNSGVVPFYVSLD